MAREIERKFIVDDWGAWVYSGDCDFSTKDITQYYIDDNTRIRLIVRENMDFVKKAFLTIKSVSPSLSRKEIEVEVPFDVKEVLDENGYPSLMKTRYTFEYKGKTWEVDDFHGPLSDFSIAEIELDSEEEKFELFPGVGQEVTGDEKYYNCYLVRKENGQIRNRTKS